MLDYPGRVRYLPVMNGRHSGFSNGATAAALIAVSLLLVSCSTVTPPPGGPEGFLARVPPLRHDASGRWPMIAWAPFRASSNDDSYTRGKPLSPMFYRELARRGFTQAIPLDKAYIPMARAIQQAGSRVIVLDGEAGNGPGAEQAGALHQFDSGYTLKQGVVSPCPLLLAGWNNHANRTRALLQKFKKSGVTLDAVWLDFETQPWSGPDQWEQARHCRRCRDLFPEPVLATAEAYRAFIGRFRQDVMSAYLAAPILEVFPKCLVANWGVVYSTADTPTPGYWRNATYSPRSAGLFTALNPVAYGNNTIYDDYWRAAWPAAGPPPLDQAHMDRLYTAVMLGQMSANAANAQQWAPEKACVPWVCRVCPERGAPGVPDLSRPRYREILRHLWLRGATSMQIFNPAREGQAESSLDELADAVQVYDEMLAYREFLDRGDILNTTVPPAASEAVLWSGLALADQALVRAFSPGPAATSVTVKPWPEGPAFTLEAPREGATYRLSAGGTLIRLPTD